MIPNTMRIHAARRATRDAVDALLLASWVPQNKDKLLHIDEAVVAISAALDALGCKYSITIKEAAE